MGSIERDVLTSCTCSSFFVFIEAVVCSTLHCYPFTALQFSMLKRTPYPLILVLMNSIRPPDCIDSARCAWVVPAWVEVWAPRPHVALGPPTLE